MKGIYNKNIKNCPFASSGKTEERRRKKKIYDRAV